MVTIASHKDADGIASAVLLMKALDLKLKDTKVVFPKEFGDVGDADYCLDMHPISDKYKGIVYDHHPEPEYPSKNKRKYKLYFGDGGSAGLVIWNKHNDTIPEKEWFKLMVSLVGDYAEECTPLEVIKSCPDLLTRMSYGSFSMFKYSKLASPINAAGRFGKHKKALKILFKAKSLDELIYHPLLAQFKDKQKILKADIETKWNNGVMPLPETIKNWCVIAVIDTKVPMQGYMASTLEGNKSITTICINEADGAISIRGTFTNFIVDALNKHGHECGGHPTASGGNIKEGKTWKDIRKIIKNII